MRGRLCHLHASFFSLFYPLFQATLILILFSPCEGAEPSALQVPVGTTWFGYDGNWSPVNIRVGSPPQWVSVLVSTASQETWVIGTGGCIANDTTCRDKRGSLFNASASSTWTSVGNFELHLDPQLNFSGVGNYGYDNVALDEQIIVPDQIVAAINSSAYLLGFMGLGVKVTNFTDVNKLSFLTTLAENQTRIPSRSYGYTAGAYYRLKGVPASLTLGGFDANRFESLDKSFRLNSDEAPVVAINEISVSATPASTSTSKPNWSANSLTLLGPADADLFTVDSSTPFLWLPEKVCDQFANALGLQYDDHLALYTFGRNSTQHDNLVNWNMTFTFRLADLPGSTNSTTTITLPYGAFDLQLTYPYPGLNTSLSSPYLNTGYNYFPLRRATNKEQYTLGRAFLQESYLMVDYDRQNFSISQAKFASDATSNVHLVSITQPKNSTEVAAGKKSSGSLSKGALAGIITGVAIGILTTVALVFLYLRRRRSGKGKPDEKTIPEDPQEAELECPLHGTKDGSLGILVDHKFDLTEVPAEPEPTELPGTSPAELPGSAPAELEGSEPAAMKDGREVSSNRGFMHKYGLRMPTSSLVHNPHKHWSSSSETTTARTTTPIPDSEPSPLTPAFSPTRAARGGGHSPSDVSPQSSQATTPLFTPLIPSPLTPAFARGDGDYHRSARDGGA
ncbi:MAG: hypothetical protein M1816_002357 [Peltula sp. TS41687]|nr:MAG: hypothetical protein M1816_002357 [Peltula sp. TS41687]